MESNDKSGGNLKSGFSDISNRVSTTTAVFRNNSLEAVRPATRNQVRETSTTRLASCPIAHVVRIRRAFSPAPAPVWRGGQEGRAARRDRETLGEEGGIE